MSLIKQLAGQTVIYGLGQILPKVLHFIVFTTYLTNRLVDRSEYAIYLDLYAYTALLLVVFSYRMDTSMFRFGRNKEDLPKVYSTALIPLLLSSLLVVTLGVFLSEQIAELLTYPQKPYYVIWFSWIIALDILNLIPFAKLRLEDRAKLFVFYKIGNVVLTVFLVFFFLEWAPEWSKEMIPIADSDIDFVFISNLIASSFLFLFLLIFHFPRKMEIDVSLWKKMALYSAPLVIVGVAASINQFFAVPLQKYLLGAEIELNKDQAAVYGAVQKIAALLALFTTAFNYAAEPFFFKNAENKDAKVIYGEIALLFVMSAGVICVSLNSLIDIFQLIIGSAYREDLYLIPILLMAYLFLGIYYNVSIWYKLADKTKYGAYISTLGAMITLLGSITLLPILGVVASAWVALACYFTMVMVAWYYGKIHYPIDYPVKRIVIHLAILVLFLLIGWWINELPGAHILIGILTVLSYLLVLYFLEGQRVKKLLF